MQVHGMRGAGPVDQEIVAANETGRPWAACSVERNKFELKVPD
jgi:hypothetical protein